MTGRPISESAERARARPKMLGTAGAWIVVLGLAGAEPAAVQARDVLEQERCQTELPLASKAAGTTGAGAGGPGAPRPRAERGLPIVVSLPTSVLSVAVVAVFIAAALALLLHRLPVSAALAPPEPAAGPPSPRRPPAPRAAADLDERLAREGRFAEAIHALLLQALAGTGAAAAQPSLTSRELLRDARMGKDARAALAALVRAVEWAHFGGRPAGAAEYEASLAEYRRLRGSWPRRS